MWVVAIKEYEYPEARFTGVLLKARYHTLTPLSYYLSWSSCDSAYLVNIIKIYFGLNRKTHVKKALVASKTSGSQCWKYYNRAGFRIRTAVGIWFRKTSPGQSR